MKIRTYDELELFKRNYLIDYSRSKDKISLLEYLQECYSHYILVKPELEKMYYVGSGLSFSEILIKISDEQVEHFDKLQESNSAIRKFLKKEIAKHKTLIEYSTSTNPVEGAFTDDKPENDFSDSLPLERMILLEKLGIINYVQSLQVDKHNEKQTAEILSSISGIPSATISKNLGVMLGYKKNDNDKNSPYKNPKNLHLADRKFNKFRIDDSKILK